MQAIFEGPVAGTASTCIACHIEILGKCHVLIYLVTVTGHKREALQVECHHLGWCMQGKALGRVNLALTALTLVLVHANQPLNAEKPL